MVFFREIMKCDKCIFSMLRCVVLSVMCAACVVSYAQTWLEVPYFCGFEDPDENSKWVAVSSTDNNFVIGTDEKCEGEKGVYIAHKNGSVVGTSDQQGYLCFYRVVTLEPRKAFEISFDWKNPGIGNSELYVCWMNDEDTVPVFSSSVWDFPSWFKEYAVTDDAVGDNEEVSDLVRYVSYSGSSLWRNVVLDVQGTGKPMKLCFFFRNKGTSNHALSGRNFPAACIDNVQINAKVGCLRPRNILYNQIDASRGQFSWEGDLGPFDLAYKGMQDTAWTEVKGITKFNNATLRYECPIRPLRKGAYIVKVKQLCGDEETGVYDEASMWTSADVIVNYSDNSCLDFLDLDGPHVSCFTGSYENPFGTEGAIPPVDFGYVSARSRHTVHYDPNEYDKWTNYNLKTTPPDGLPSVRLGNYITASDLGSASSMAEAITYHYHVDPDAPILLIKFALLLEDARHGEQNDPKFELQITDPVTGEDMAGLLCGRVDFVANFDDPTFRHGAVTTHDGSPVMLYKDWTTTGLNLQPIAGQDIDITFISKECSRTGHASYAYFTMDCMGAKISGVGCGDDMFGQIEAPDGFNYKWYPLSLTDGLDPSDAESAIQDYFADPNFKDTDKTFSPPGGISDDGIYVCRIFSKEEENCWFELQADLDPRDVFAGSEVDITYADCKAVVKFNNNSYTKTRNRGDIGTCDHFLWDFGDGNFLSDESPEVTLKPGTYNISMLASIADGLCEDVWDTTLTILPYGASVDTIHVRRCTKDPNYTFIDGITYNTTGVRKHTLQGFAGCDSVVVLDMVVGEEILVEYSDTVTDEQVPYKFFDQELYTTGTYDAVVEGLGDDCDTLYTLHLNVWPVLHVDFAVDDMSYACSGDTVIEYAYSVRSGTLEKYSIEFDDKSQEAGFADQTDVPYDSENPENVRIPIPEDIDPGQYAATITFDGDTTGIEVFEFDVNVFYNSSILTQKWNDVIAIYNADNNGGYEFDSYSWYRNGELVQGAVAPYLKIDGAELDFTATYQARVRRVSDGVVTYTCPFTPEDRTYRHVNDYPVITVYPTKVAPNGKVKVQLADPDAGNIYVEVTDVLGRKCMAYSPVAGNFELTLPDYNGLFIMRFYADGGLIQTVKVLVQ